MNYNIFILKRLLFLGVFFGVCAQKVAFEFNGIAPGKPTEQAIIAREFARGNGLTSKTQSPAAIGHMARANYNGSYFQNTPNIHYAPLYPFVLGCVYKIAGVEKLTNTWILDDSFYVMDLIALGLSLVFFLGALFISYNLITQLFTRVVASATLIVLSLSPALWSLFLQAGSDAMVFFLFSLSCFMLFKAYEKPQKSLLFGSLSILAMLLATLTDWIAIWAFIGLMLSILLCKKSVYSLQIIGWVTLAVILTVQAYTNVTTSSSLLGMSFIDVLAAGDDRQTYMAMFNLTANASLIKSVLLKFVVNIYGSLSKFPIFQAGFFLAPCFLLSLLHTFKQESINTFRYAAIIITSLILIGAGALNPMDTENFSSGMIVFVTSPITIAFAIAFVVILISRYRFRKDQGESWVSWLVISLSIIPFGFSIYRSFSSNNVRSDIAAPYKELSNLVGNNIIVSDSPTTTSWYSDTYSVLTPTNFRSVQQLRALAAKEGLQVSGVYFSEKSIVEMNTYKQNSRLNNYFTLASYPMLPKFFPESLPQYSEAISQSGFAAPVELVAFNKIYYPFANE